MFLLHSRDDGCLIHISRWVLVFDGTEHGRRKRNGICCHPSLPRAPIPFYSLLLSKDEMRRRTCWALSLSLSRARRPSSVNDGMESDQVEKEKIGGSWLCAPACLSLLARVSHLL